MSARWPSLQALLSPASVAVVGASDNPDKVGGRPLRYLLQQGFAGRVHAVNPRANTVQGLPAHASLAELPEVPDAAVLCVSADQAEAQLALCARLGVRQALLFASGYAEVGEDGRRRHQRLLDLCREGGVRLVGPNSIGVASFDSGAVLSFASIYSDHAPQDGPVAIVSQSGAVGVTLYALLRQAGIGVRCVAATGNEADLNCADFIAAMALQGGVRLLLLYLEQVPDAARLEAALVMARDAGMAVVAVRAARSPEGRGAAQCHTGSNGAGGPVLDALFAAAGCRTVADLGELVAGVPLYLSAGAATGPSPAVPRLAVVSNSGASCVMAADQAHLLGLPLAALGAGTVRQLDALLPAFSLGRNPIDLTAMLLADPALLGAVMRCVLDDDAVDAAVLGLLAIGGPSYDVARFAAEVHEAAARAGKPVVMHSAQHEVRQAFVARGLAVSASEGEALRVLQGFAAHRAGAAAAAPLRPPPREAATPHRDDGDATPDAPLALDGIAALRALKDGPARCGPWLTVDQATIQRFAEATGDRQWIHLDVDRAARESPYGRTIAHGLLTLSLLPTLLAGLFSYPGRKTSVNYGFDRVRFTAAVPEGGRVRPVVRLADLDELQPGEARVAWDVTLELEGSARPALVARWLVQMRY